jgi:hypothetical protein
VSPRQPSLLARRSPLPPTNFLKFNPATTATSSRNMKSTFFTHGMDGYVPWWCVLVPKWRRKRPFAKRIQTRRNSFFSFSGNQISFSTETV